jgi:hypothetical protein
MVLPAWLIWIEYSLKPIGNINQVINHQNQSVPPVGVREMNLNA